MLRSNIEAGNLWQFATTLPVGAYLYTHAVPNVTINVDARCNILLASHTL